MSDNVPFGTKILVAVRDLGSCLKCGEQATDFHHRRRRNIKDEHTHCTCNVVCLCKTCHMDVHTWREQARVDGLIVPSFLLPRVIPVIVHDQVQALDCNGKWKQVTTLARTK
jgi:hypothetical protein